MNVIKSEITTRKWKWIADQLKHHEGTEEAQAIAREIDKYMIEIYGKHTHSAQWILDFRIWKHDKSLISIVDMATKWNNCTACMYSMKEGKPNCTICEFAKKGGRCTEYDPNKELPLFKLFIDSITDFKDRMNRK